MKQMLLSACLMLASLSAPAQEVVYLKQSEMFAFVMGQQTGQAIGQAADIRQQTAQRQGNYARLDALRKELAACGNCADRTRLQATVNELQTKLVREDRTMCGAWDAIGGTDPAAMAMKKLLGYGEVCDRYAKESAIAGSEGRHKANKEAYAKATRANQLEAYGTMYQDTMSAYSHLPFAERQQIACPYLFAGAKKGEPMSTAQLASECLLTSPVEGDRKDAFDMLKSCAEHQHPYCTSTLAGYYESTRRKDYVWPVKADDQEALRLYEELARGSEKALASAKGRVSREAAEERLAEYRQSAERVRARLYPGTVLAAASAPMTAASRQEAMLQRVRASAQQAVRSTQAKQAAAQAEARTDARADVRADARQRRCDAMQRSVDRARDAAEKDPVRHEKRVAATQAVYDKNCKD